MKKEKVLEGIEVISIGHKGESIGKTKDGEVVLIQGGVPGDIVNMRTRRKKKGLKYGFVDAIVRPSEHRTDPICSHFGSCGGCKWQNLSYDEQVSQKQEQVVSAIRRIGGLEHTIVKPIAKAKNIYKYRNKLEFTFSPKRWVTQEEIDSGTELEWRGLGFHRPMSFERIVDLDICHLMDEPVNSIRNEIRAWAIRNDYSFYNPRKGEGLLRNLMVRRNESGQVMLLLVIKEYNEELLSSFSQLIQSAFSEVKTAAYIINNKKNDSVADLDYSVLFGPGYIIERLDQIRYMIGPKSFFQTNTGQAEILYGLVSSYANLKMTDVVLDLYCGVGSIGLYLARQCKEVIGIEEIPEAITDARKNAEANEIENARFMVGDVKTVLDPDFQLPDVIITDPPRVGMHPDVVDNLLRIRAPKIVYVSCNPATMARDLKTLSESYHIPEITPVDMFPHTSHIEAVAVLTLQV